MAITLDQRIEFETAAGPIDPDDVDLVEELLDHYSVVKIAALAFLLRAESELALSPARVSSGMSSDHSANFKAARALINRLVAAIAADETLHLSDKQQALVDSATSGGGVTSIKGVISNDRPG